MGISFLLLLCWILPLVLPNASAGAGAGASAKNCHQPLLDRDDDDWDGTMVNTPVLITHRLRDLLRVAAHSNKPLSGLLQNKEDIIFNKKVDTSKRNKSRYELRNHDAATFQQEGKQKHRGHCYSEDHNKTKKKKNKGPPEREQFILAVFCTVIFLYSWVSFVDFILKRFNLVLVPSLKKDHGISPCTSKQNNNKQPTTTYIYNEEAGTLMTILDPEAEEALQLGASLAVVYLD